MAGFDIDPVALKQLDKKLGTDCPKVAGGDQIKLFRGGIGIGEKAPQRRGGGGRHRRAHIVLVGHPQILDGAYGGGAEIGRLVSLFQHNRAGGGRRPLGGRRPHRAVFEREAVLPFGGTEVGGGHRHRPAHRLGIHQQRGQKHPLGHGRTGAVKSKKRNPGIAQAEGGADALVQQIPREDAVDILIGERRVGKGLGHGQRNHPALRLFP